MNIQKLTLTRIVQIATGLAGLTGAYGFLYMMGAFGPVSCWTSASSSQTATESGGITSSGTTVTRGCEAGIDYLLGGTGGNASVLFFWAVILLAFVILGGVAAWTPLHYCNSRSYRRNHLNSRYVEYRLVFHAPNTIFTGCCNSSHSQISPEFQWCTGDQDLN